MFTCKKWTPESMRMQNRKDGTLRLCMPCYSSISVSLLISSFLSSLVSLLFSFSLFFLLFSLSLFLYFQYSIRYRQLFYRSVREYYNRPATTCSTRNIKMAVTRLTSSSSVLWLTTHAQSGRLLLALTSRNCKYCNPSVFALRITHLGTLITVKFTRILGFHSSTTTSEHWLRALTQS
jgi:hypothetical protein